MRTSFTRQDTFLRLDDCALLPQSLRGAVVAIGNFDGVHRGHQAVLECALAQARKHGRPAVVLTFEPHPRSFFKPLHPVDRLTSAAEKAQILRLMGFDAVIEQTFNREFAASSAEAFVHDVLCGLLHVAGVVTGDNFHFGRRRQGNPVFLRQAGEKLGFAVHVIDALKDEDGEVVSSSRIRRLLVGGTPEKAAALLGYRYTVPAKVVRGAKLGRTLGFPTANMILAPRKHLAPGIYAVRFRRASGRLYDGVAAFGRRPTVNTLSEPLLETFLFDFSGDLYDEVCSVSFFSLIRPERKFEGLEPLVAQMHQDEAAARTILAGVSPLSPLDHHLTFVNWP